MAKGGWRDSWWCTVVLCTGGCWPVTSLVAMKLLPDGWNVLAMALLAVVPMGLYVVAGLTSPRR